MERSRGEEAKMVAPLSSQVREEEANTCFQGYYLLLLNISSTCIPDVHGIKKTRVISHNIKVHWNEIFELFFHQSTPKLNSPRYSNLKVTPRIIRI
jgi:hypothetical protein